MGKTIIVTDSDCSLPPALSSEYHIMQVPIIINFGDRSYTTGIDVNDRTLFEMVNRLNKLPSTSAPAPDAFAKVFKAAFADGYDTVVCITVSSVISATYNAAVIARDMMPKKDITVIDSLNLSLGQGFMAMAASKAAARGASPAEIKALVENMNKRTHIYGVLPTLKYLAMSGRVKKLAAGMADTLSIKPILTSRDGKLDLLEKVRTQRKANDRLLELVKIAINGKPIEKLGFIHVNNPQGAGEIYERLSQMVPCPDDALVAEFTAGLSVHTGEGVVGIAVVTG
jgi:DegV family protein with EDD domain